MRDDLSLTHRLTAHMHDLKQQGLYRHRQIVDDEHCISFSSNDYLALRHDVMHQRAYQTGFTKYPAGSGGSMVISGYHRIHREVEQSFAAALNVDDCLLFSSGYAANLSLVSLLTHYSIPILLDKGVHASFYAGLNSLNVRYQRYRHNDQDDFLRLLSLETESCAVVTESLFSMSGQLAPLSKMGEFVFSHGSVLLVDEAHAFGVVGPEGMGAVRQADLSLAHVPLRVLPLGKAFAASGALIAGDSLWIEALLQAAKPYIYSTGMSPAYAYGLLKTLDQVRAADDRRAHLQTIIAYFRSKIRESSCVFRDSSTVIQQLQLGCPHRALAYAKHLREHHIICLPMRQPTVSKKETGLRIILNAQHKTEHIDHLFNVLHSMVE